jgi:GT2 family glycosyltransferase
VDGVRLLRNTENLGFAAANNMGLELATGEYVALINDDAVTAADWARRLVEFLEAHPAAAAAGGRQFRRVEQNPVGDRSNRFRTRTIVHDDGTTPALFDEHDATREVATLNGAAVLIRRAAIESVGEPFLDPAYFMYYEETDFFARALCKGWKLFYVGGADCWHPYRAALPGRSDRSRFLLSRNRVLFAYRYLDDPALARVVCDVRRRGRIGWWKRAIRRDPKHRLNWETWRWTRDHHAFLVRERARCASDRRVYLGRIREIQR